MKRITALALALALCTGSRSAFASCTVSATAVDFGTYAPLTGASDPSTGTITLQCTAPSTVNLSWTIALGTGNSGSYVARTMNDGSGNLQYQLYTDSAYQTIWGDGTNGTSQVSGSVLLQLGITYTTSYTVYGLIPGAQNVAPGTYNDSIVVTVTY